MEKTIDLERILHRYDELSLLLSDPEVIQDIDRYLQLTKEYNQLETPVQLYRSYSSKLSDYEANQGLLDIEKDPEMLALIEEDQAKLSDEISELEKTLKREMRPHDPRDQRSIYLEIRAGAGGDEAALFARDLYRMYLAYADSLGYQCSEESISENEIGGIKEVVFQISGTGAYSKFKYEMGVHRVQRVPETESGGRIHTSTVTVAVMPEADEVELSIDPKDLRIDTYRASGAGGQHVNMTDSAIRITHIPTGTVVTCQDERSQIKNRERAMKVLRAKLYEQLLADQHEEQADARRQQIGHGDRSERIRTYNFPQGRVSDHRINLTLYKIDDILKGDLGEIVEALGEAEYQLSQES
ncbi:MAG: peptide chain release factor 1 [Eubacteriales bacterium]|nr:peptide chain release factor 1 [Eubacteriales bacterium]